MISAWIDDKFSLDDEFSSGFIGQADFKNLADDELTSA